MATKATGAEFKKFYADETMWPKGTYHDDTILCVDGVEQEDGIDPEKLSDTAIVHIKGGYLVGPQWEHNEGPSLEIYFKRWRKAQNTALLSVECDKSVLEAVKAAIRSAGGKVV